MIGPFWLSKGGGDQVKRILLKLRGCVVRFCGGRSGAKDDNYDVIVMKYSWNV